MLSLFFLLLSVVLAGVTEGMISVHPTYNAGRVRFEVVDSNNEKLSGLQVIVSRNNEEEAMTGVLRNGAYEINTELPVGISTFNVRIHSQEGKTLFSDEVAVVSTVQFTVPSVSVTIDKKTTEISLPALKLSSFELEPKTNVVIKTTPQTVNDFVPTTALLVIASSEKKISIPMVKNENSFEISFVPSRNDIALPFNYEKGNFEFMILFGDCLIASPISLSIFKATVDFGPVPEEPIYPIYSKPLLYQSENSVKPLKEIEHVFKPENKNPFFLFPLGFSIAIVASVFVLLMVFKKIGFVRKNDVISKTVWKILFFLCICTIVALYIYFWVGWNMLSLLKVLLPFAAITVVIGNRAL